MCGIVGYVGNKPVVPLIIEGLRRLEYRGYDSAGIAVGSPRSDLELRRAPGKLRNLEEVIREHPLHGTFGIGHTRWATHGRPTEENAHPHRDCSGRLVVVHNGIVENYLALKHELITEGHKFVTETDTEIIAHLIEQELSSAAESGKTMPLEEAVRRAARRLTGAYAIGVISADDPDKIVAARNGPPAVIGLGEGEYFVASDVPGILHHTRDLYFLADGDVAILTKAGVQLTNLAGEHVERPVQRILWDPIQAEKSGYKHFMLKEIFEQPRAIRDTTLGRISLDTGKVYLSEMKITEDDFRNATKINIAACGTSWHAATAGKFMIERLARVPVEVDYASEYRYRDPIADPSALGLLITQSGETADTIAAQREMVAKGMKTIAICNVVGAMIAREAHGTIYTHAGPEIGVASTKAFTAQLVALFLFAVHLAQKRETISTEESSRLLESLSLLPGKVEEILRTVDSVCEQLAKTYSTARDFLFLGRGIHYPIALEGALKLKEISYIHAEGYPAGEMKHGPNALIDETLPVVVLATKDNDNRDSRLRYEKTLSNIQEVTARSGKVIAVAIEGDEEIKQLVDHVLYVPSAPELLLPVLEVVPLQLLAYHIAVRRGCDVDQPRNLAKSVTVE
ncbi:glucosamine--fructose-6-phosphate aminotransferase (isomerizing) [Silvibacterium bohemicum]|uniref:Glutamine--fructose-6-phosphate aminotransferase [isomerizing] n=1 Tax=Silvibacterium bohemicum TaxID=1577686 RepID=A0A841JTG1_9BACT|nr:glutamine--fructose-6-phosphate transaminase (isomerizing) [Silvibacterium bohemicum]MBB6144692.1 glucosamine--fructose-6-phosphate aminotransferase (isomerizing) [Silvibacterium bohemicum]